MAIPCFLSRQKYCFFIKTLWFNMLLNNKLRLIILNLSLLMTFVILQLPYSFKP